MAVIVSLSHAHTQSTAFEALDVDGMRNPSFLPFLIPQRIVLPRQARDKNPEGKHSKKEALFSFSGNGTLDHDEFRDGLKALKVRKL